VAGMFALGYALQRVVINRASRRMQPTTAVECRSRR